MPETYKIKMKSKRVVFFFEEKGIVILSRFNFITIFVQGERQMEKTRIHIHFSTA